MSRTHVHTPVWVLQLRPDPSTLEEHTCIERGHDCDLGQVSATKKWSRCDYDTPWDVWKKHYRSDTEKDRRHSDWWAPDRSHNRDTLRGFAAEYNTYGAVADDTDAPTRDHRHHTYKGGYWN
ncbi:hypothetical protein [Leifsonia sp. Leaf264]|uniref:hypothetical protein n=1 Tax=Leifsonia sp. Leaf264 TaxID=1736314 RepID=UPI0006F30614|nr:hypothetical protein [Leifsonia sp. Leaf264]KQO98134.1 hypothetical protein ASF30_08625 [Leifsonia sp. Leaf264]